MKIFQPRNAIMPKTSFYAERVRAYPNAEWPNSPDFCYHDFFECELFYGGAGIHSVNFRDHRIRRGMFYLLEPYDCHVYRADPATPLEVFNLKFAAALLSPGVHALLKQCRKPYVCYFEPDEFARVEAELQLVRGALERMTAGEGERELHREMVRTAVDRIVLLLIGCLDRAVLPDGEAGQDERLRRVIEWLDLHYKEKITLADAARVAGLTEKYFSRYFKRHVSMNFIEYLYRTRVRFAAQLIDTTNMSLKEVAYSTGFATGAHFSRVFKQYMGISPQEYARGIRTL